jgi:hypothetical protein
MNTLDAIIAMLLLLTSFGIILGTISVQKEYLLEAKNSLGAKNDAYFCMGIIDSIYANSASTYDETIECFVKEGKVMATKNGKQKFAEVIPKIKRENELEVGTIDHYK